MTVEVPKDSPEEAERRVKAQLFAEVNEVAAIFGASQLALEDFEITRGLMAHPVVHFVYCPSRKGKPSVYLKELERGIRVALRQVGEDGTNTDVRLIQAGPFPGDKPD